jgi:AraC-like DNA-binding protein
MKKSFENMRPASLPEVTVVEITDPTIANDGSGALTRDLLQLEPKALRAKQVTVRLEDSMVLFTATNRRVRARTVLHSGLLAYVVFGPQAKGTINGLLVKPDLMLAAESGTQIEVVAEAGYESVTVLFSSDLLASHLNGRQRKDTLRAPQGVEVLQTKKIHARELFDWGKRLATTAARHPELFNDRKETLAAAKNELLEMLLAAFDATKAAQRTRSDHTRQAYSRIVKLAEDYALACTGDRLYMMDLCVATGVRERTLEYAFKKVMCMSPVAYLTRLRLHRVRQALQMATHGSTTVSAQALNWGFWHLGDFSRAYKDCFGELPSETLQRRPAETGSNPKAFFHFGNRNVAAKRNTPSRPPSGLSS